MEILDLSYNSGIDNEGATFLMGCLHKLEYLKVNDCKISSEKENELKNQGYIKGCKWLDKYTKHVSFLINS